MSASAFLCSLARRNASKSRAVFCSVIAFSPPLSSRSVGNCGVAVAWPLAGSSSILVVSPLARVSLVGSLVFSVRAQREVLAYQAYPAVTVEIDLRGRRGTVEGVVGRVLEVALDYG